MQIVQRHLHTYKTISFKKFTVFITRFSGDLNYGATGAVMIRRSRRTYPK